MGKAKSELDWKSGGSTTLGVKVFRCHQEGDIAGTQADGRGADVKESN